MKKGKAKVEAVKGFSGQLSGQEKKEAWFGNLRKEMKFKLPAQGNSIEIKLPKEKLDGAFLSCLDGGGALSINGAKVSKMKVYSGEIGLPPKFNLSLVVQRVSDVNCRLKANIVSC